MTIVIYFFSLVELIGKFFTGCSNKSNCIMIKGTRCEKMKTTPLIHFSFTPQINSFTNV
jgi:hypothetical protein